MAIFGVSPYFLHHISLQTDASDHHYLLLLRLLVLQSFHRFQTGFTSKKKQRMKKNMSHLRIYHYPSLQHIKMRLFRLNSAENNYSTDQLTVQKNR